MMKLLCATKQLLSNPELVFPAMVGISAFSLAAAFTAEYGFGLEPCILCLYQRIPFLIAILLGFVGWAMRSSRLSNLWHLGFLSLVFAANAILAFYHAGVEQHWWVSFLEGCAVPEISTDPDEMLQIIMAAPTVRCDEIPWADPILGLSMAAYNALLCLGLSILCGLSFVFVKQTPQAPKAS